MTAKNIHKICIPKKYSFFWKPPKNIEIQDFEPPKMLRAYVHVFVKIPELPPPPAPTP